MKVGSDGQWTGLAYSDDAQQYVDFFSSPDEWEIGFDVVYRLVLYTDEATIVGSFRQAFIDAFGLPRDHYDIKQAWVGGSVFWRAYWDKDAFDLKLLRECDKRLDIVAQRSGQRLLVIGVAIIPRSKRQIAEMVEFNK